MALNVECSIEHLRTTGDRDLFVLAKSNMEKKKLEHKILWKVLKILS